jgi:acetyltransferase-like isoleucine patch superfamily enzyme
MLRYVRPKYLASILRAVLLKMKYGRHLQFDMMRTFFGSGFELSIVNGGGLRLDGSRDRIYFGRGVTIICSGGFVQVGAGTFFNAGCRVTSHQNITIGADCLFSPNVSIYDSDHGFGGGRPVRHSGYDKSSVSIGNNCWLGTNAVVLRGSAIESDVVVGANSVVRGVLKARGVYAGIPSKLIKPL